MGNVKSAIEKVGGDKTRLMDVLIDIQESQGYISGSDVDEIASSLNISKVDVEQTLSFYHFFKTTPAGKYTVYLNNSVVAEMMGAEEVAKAFEEAAGCSFGSTTSDGQIGLYRTSCIGMNDQEPAAIINNKVFTSLSPDCAKSIVKAMKEGKPVDDLSCGLHAHGADNHPLIKSMVKSNIKREGKVVFTDFVPGKGLEKISTMSPEDVIAEMRSSNLRGRGGAGFPTGMKWDFCRKSAGDRKFVFCNADEGEPGTFKDRVILTEKAPLVFEGMAIAGYAIGASEGILYLRYEYKYMQEFLESVLEDLRSKNILGKNAGGKSGFDFDIRIQFGAGAYVCGEESALIDSAEGKRGEPRDRPPFPVEKGYLDLPTSVNNVETLCKAVKILEKGAGWFKEIGTVESTGTKLLSISGDCDEPGVYEIEFGMSISEMLNMVGARDVQAVQVGGPSGTLIAPNEFGRSIGFEDLATGGSMIVFNNSRNLVKDVVLNFVEFFIEESCGSCAPCRIMEVVLRDKLLKIINGKGIMSDISDMESWGKIMKVNRCGLGQTAANPILTSIKNFRPLYEEMIQAGVDYDTGFDLEQSVKESCEVVGRVPNL